MRKSLSSVLLGHGLIRVDIRALLFGFGQTKICHSMVVSALSLLLTINIVGPLITHHTGRDGAELHLQSHR